MTVSLVPLGGILRISNDSFPCSFGWDTEDG